MGLLLDIWKLSRHMEGCIFRDPVPVGVNLKNMLIIQPRIGNIINRESINHGTY